MECALSSNVKANEQVKLAYLIGHAFKPMQFGCGASKFLVVQENSRFYYLSAKLAKKMNSKHNIL